LSAWHLITCEYPPQIGGVSDYAFVMAKELASTGEPVHVWCGSAQGDCAGSPGVTVHRELGRFSLRNLYHAGKLLDRFPGPRKLFVQWVPHGYGYRSMNIVFCLWLWLRARVKHDQVQIMFHEVWLSFGISWKANIAAAMHRVMVALLKHAASKIWIAGESWKEYLQGAPVPVGWLPVPSNVSCRPSPGQIAAVREQCNGTGNQIVGQFGIGDALVEQQLRFLVPALLRERSTLSFLLIGKDSERVARKMQQEHPDVRDRIFASGVLPPEEIAAHIGACDLMIQPYVDGISTRRTAAMAVLANGRALLTTSGHSTERFWKNCNQIKIVPARDSAALVAQAIQLLNDDAERSRMAAAGQNLYEGFFTVTASAGVLRGASQSLTTDFLGHVVLGMKQ